MPALLLASALALLATAAAPAPAAEGVFSLDRLTLGSGSGPEAYLFTAGNRINPQGGVDAGTYYRFVVTDGSGGVRNPTFACTSAAAFTSTDNTYVVASADPPSSGAAWTYTLQQFATSSCSGSPAKTASRQFRVAKATAYGDSTLGTPVSSLRGGAPAYVTVAGLPPSGNDWSVTWLRPSTATACANTAGNDRPDSSAGGRLPKNSGSFLQYTPAGGAAWNREANYDTQPCVGTTSEDGTWSLKLALNATNAVVLTAFAVDTTPPPAPVVTAQLPNPSNSTGASFAFSDGEAGVAFLCRLDAASFSSCTSPKSYSALAEGAHTFQVKARDDAGNESPASSHAWTIDTTAPPAPAIGSGPPNPSNSTGASFAFSDGEAGVAFLCRLDAASFSSCTSPKSYSALAEGAHTFQVKARDDAGNESPASSHAWTISIPPILTLTTPAGGAFTNDSTPTFAGTASTAAGDDTTVTVRVYEGTSVSGNPWQTLTAIRDATGLYAVDASPALGDATYTARAEQSDVGGGTGYSATTTFTVDTAPPPPPRLDSTPSNPSALASATFAFSDSEPGVAWSCKLDGGAFAGCTSPQTYSGLADGSHTFQVKARDAAGNESTIVSFTWTIDAPPHVTLNFPADGSWTTDTTPTVSGTAGNGPADSTVVTVKVYAGATVGPTPVQTLTVTRAGTTFSVDAGALAEGTYTARAEQSDATSTGFSTPNTFVVDTTPPSVSVTTPADGSTTSDSTPTFSGSAGTAPGDSGIVTVRVFAGSSAIGPPVQTLVAVRAGSAWSVDAAASLPDATYTAVAYQEDAAGNGGMSPPSVFSIVPSQSYRDAVLSDQPRSYWRLAELGGTVAADEKGANPGTYNGGVSLGAPGALVGDSNPAASFDGVNDYVVVPDSASLDVTTGGVTLESWVKRTKSGAWQVLVGKPGNGLSKYENYALWINTLNQVVAYFGDGTAYVSVAAPLDTNWRHVVATYDNANANLYIDGNVAATSSSAVRLTSNALPLNFARTNSGGSFFGGVLDEVAVYGTVLSPARILAHYNLGRAIDTAPPQVALNAPAHATSTSDTTPTFSGTAGNASGDSQTVTVRVYAGLDALGTPVQTLTTARQGTSYSVDAGSALASGTYTAQAFQSDASGNTGRSSANTFAVGSPAPSPQRVLVAAGDIASCTEAGDTATGLLLGQFPNAVVATLGDNAYPGGTAQQFADCYDPTWGSAKARTRPTLGTHDYGDVQNGSLAGYVGYFQSQLALFGPSASDPSRAYYSYDLGAWHVVVLNAACVYYAPGCSPAAQEQWLRTDLESRPAACTLAYFHNPLFTSGAVHAGDPEMRRYWNVLYTHGADVVLTGHNHQYERFAPQDPGGVNDPQYGIREFVVGTGGADFYGFSTTRPNSEVRNTGTYGVIKLTLGENGFDWQFVPEAGKTFTDTGSQQCHGAPPA